MFVKSMQKDGKDVESGLCKKDERKRLGLSTMERTYEKIMNEENNWVQVTNADMMEGPVENLLCKNYKCHQDHENWEGGWIFQSKC